MTDDVATNSKLLLNEILKIPGDKIVTLVTVDCVFKVDVNKEGQIGYEEGVELLFLAKLINAINNGGSLIIRQFLSIRVQREVSNGKKVWIPEKNIYGVLLGNNTWRGCTAEEVRANFNTDADTGKELEVPEDIHYQDFDTF